MKNTILPNNENVNHDTTIKSMNSKKYQKRRVLKSIIKTNLSANLVIKIPRLLTQITCQQISLHNYMSLFIIFKI